MSYLIIPLSIFPVIYTPPYSFNLSMTGILTGPFAFLKGTLQSSNNSNKVGPLYQLQTLVSTFFYKFSPYKPVIGIQVTYYSKLYPTLFFKKDPNYSLIWSNLSLSQLTSSILLIRIIKF